MGVRGGLVAAFFASAIYNFFLSEPVLQFGAASADEYVPLIAFNLCAIISGGLAGRLNERARIAERAQGRLNVLLTASDQLQKAVVPRDVSSAMNSPELGQWFARVELYDASGGYIALDATPPKWSVLATTTLNAEAPRAETEGARAYRLQNASGVMGALVFGWSDSSVVNAAVDMDELVAMIGMTLERCLLLERLSETEAIRRSEELKTALLSSLSHDMRTPISAIATSASSLLSFSDDLDSVLRVKLLRTIAEQCERLDRYTASLLNLGLLQSGIPEGRLIEVDVVDIMGAVLRAVRSNAPDRDIAKQFDCSLALVRADPVMIEQILMNILDNALRYSPTDTTIAVRVSKDMEQVRVEILDQGCGIPCEELPRVFDRFYRSTRTSAQEGSGLGLSIAQGFAAAFGGSVTLHSPHSAGQGTQAIILLPLFVSERERAYG